jgi:hypothetical protein
MSLGGQFLSAVTVVIVISACSKGTNGENDANGTPKDTSGPVITIVSPTDHQTFTAGQTIQTSANAIDNVKVTELHIHVIDKSTGSLLRDIHSYPGAVSGTVQDAFTAKTGLTYTIKIIANDPSQNLTTSQVEVSVH